MEYTDLTKRDITLIKESYKKIREKSEESCWSTLYKRLFEINPETVKLFKGDIKEQERRIMNMMNTVIEGLNNVQIIFPALQELGKRHFEYGVKKEYYVFLGEALFYTIEKESGKDFTKEVRNAWEKLYEIMSEVMQGNLYDDSKE
ncbi:MAG: hypothetical protein FJ216_08425 [Ignavibacteria bacterium]|nr:hypothetical protein [Ignavibacteria bacterium]